MRIKRYAAVFSLGSVIYSLLEIIWRGYTHWTMALTGGFCLSCIYAFNDRVPRAKLWQKCLVGTGVITASEFGVGMLVNRTLHWNVWDYSDMPMNLCGQICPVYSLLWFLLCIPAVGVCSAMKARR